MSKNDSRERTPCSWQFHGVDTDNLVRAKFREECIFESRFEAGRQYAIPAQINSGRCRWRSVVAEN